MADDVRRVANTLHQLSGKLDTIGRRSPKDLHALDVLADLVLDRLNAQGIADPLAHVWRCDDPCVTKGGA